MSYSLEGQKLPKTTTLQISVILMHIFKLFLKAKRSQTEIKDVGETISVMKELVVLLYGDN